MANTLSIEVEQFLLKYIESVEQLEVLLLLNAHPDRPWTIQEVNDQIKSSEESVSKRLQTLAHQGLITALNADKTVFQIQTAKPEINQTVSALDACYKERRLKVLECVFSKPMSSLRVFADSFKIRKDDSNA